MEEKDGPIKVFEVELIQRETFYVAAESKDEAMVAAKQIKSVDASFGHPEVRVTEDLIPKARMLAEKFHREIIPPDPDCGVINGEIVDVREYLAQRVWRWIDGTGDVVLTCPSCGFQEWAVDFNKASGVPKHGYLPELACPDCKTEIDWVELIRFKQKVDKDG